MELIIYNFCMEEKVIVYHGSEKIIDHPRIGFGSPKNDYGYGFYCTLDKDAACIWANRNGGYGYCNQYKVKQNGLKILDLTKEDVDALYWISLLLQHRTLDETDRRKYKTLLEGLFKKYPVSIQGVDIIIGYRADDRYFRYCKDFLSSQLDYDSLVKALKLGKLGKQYVLVSMKAFQNMKFIKADKIADAYLHSYAKLIDKANDDYLEIFDTVDQENGIFIREKLYGKH